MSDSLRLCILIIALLIVIGAWGMGILLTMKVSDPNPDLRDAIRNFFWTGNFGAAAFIGMAANLVG